MSDPSALPPVPDIIARPGRYYRNARYVVIALALGAGLWFAYDGWVRYPSDLKNFEALPLDQRGGHTEPHDQFQINVQCILASGLISLAPLLLAFYLYRSRGVYRLSGTTLFIPGHPPVPLENIMGIDLSKWERKGIAYIDYAIDPAPQSMRMTIDDFIYEQTPTHKIVARIEVALKAEGDQEMPTSPGR